MLFRRTDKYGYSRYYGDGGPAWIIKIILSIVICVALVLGGAMLVLQHFMVYTEDGAHLELPELPKFHITLPKPKPGSGDKSTAEDEGEDKHHGFLPIIDDTEEVEGEGDTSAEAEEPTAPVNNARELEGGLLVQHVSIGDVTGGYAEGTLKGKGANGIMLFMKESGGSLNYASKLTLADELGVSAGREKADSIRSVVNGLNGDYYTLAYLNTFDDKKLGGEDTYALKKQGGGTWSDSNDVKWADPANEKVQSYIVDMVGDMADMGFDEVVLYCASYPYGKKADKVSTDADREAVITDFYTKLAEVSKQKDITVSLVADPDVILGKDSRSGQTLENLKLTGGRIWVMADEAEDKGALEKAVKDAGFQSNALGFISGKLEKDSSYPWLNQD